MPIYIPNIKVRYQSINEILTIKKYWNIFGREPFLAIITWKAYFSQVCSFCRMVKNHKQLLFYNNSGQKKRLHFLKKSKKLFFLALFDHFWHHFFQKNPALSHITKYASKHHVKFQKKQISQFWENVWSNRRKERLQGGQTDGRIDPLSYGSSGHIQVSNKRNYKKKSQIKHCLTTLNIAKAICWK